jgi:hypothetical protein
MTRSDWLELVQLAQVLCPPVLQDLHLIVETDARGILAWLRARASEARES